ncbi:peripheral-type benzodiazepine receptor-associated protein 1 isoform X5 [Corythoichthys intestinalis]|uniref:peripheral-type benzodiazepine receptor-associated protein 1 isoform X5 n=1 Tax=Corythoichthys intestinalis TaxID=161448 RepID=UPI0025A5E705|nr:peripheral-type benzodiazepine receptor-associated protein 1 isoform X5 [Corythoichthys intestinalis]
MLGCDCGTMKKDGDNSLVLSSKKPHLAKTNNGLELETLRAAVEVEEEQTDQTIPVELRHLQEPLKSVRQVTSRHVCQKKRHSSSQRCPFNGSTIDTFSSARKTQKNLEQLLLMLSGKLNSEQEVSKLQRQELELEKAVILCHLLETHQDFLHKRQIARHLTQNSSSISQIVPQLTHSRTSQRGSKTASCSSQKKTKPDHSIQQSASNDLLGVDACTASVEVDTCWSSALKICHPHNTPHAQCNDQLSYHTQSTGSDESPPFKCVDTNMENGADYRFLVRQNFELLRALDELKKTCNILREENCLLRRSSAPETEEKVRRLRRKNTELAVLAKRLEERARKLQDANLKMVSSSSLIRPGSVEQYKRAFARQRARDLAQHADALLCKDKEIAALQHDLRELEARLGSAKGSPVQQDRVEFEKLLRESQREVLRLQRQLAITSTGQHQNHNPDPGGPEKALAKVEVVQEEVVRETPRVPLDESLSTCERTPGEEEEESGLPVTPHVGLGLTPSHQDKNSEKNLQYLESELTKKRKECEHCEHEAKKRQKKCLDLESQLEDEKSKNEKLKEEADLLRRKAQLLDQTRVENEELREELSKVTAQHNSVLEENQRLCAKLENLEQVLKHMREVAERRQQLELEHEQALAILKFKQDEIKRLQRAQLFAKREHEGVVQMLESTLDCMQSKVRDLEEKCRSQSEQFGLLSRELEKFRLQASKTDLAGAGLLNHPSLSVLTNGVGLSTERDCTDGSWDMESLSEIAFWSLEGGDTLSCPEDVAAALRLGTTPHAAGLSRVERSPITKHRELPTISVSKSSSSKSETANITPKSDTHLSPHKSSPTHEVDTASEVEELDVDMAPAPYAASRGASKLQVFIARYSYNPYDGPNDNPEMELPLTAGEYIYVYGGMDDDGFYEGELVDGRRGLVPSNFVERVSDDDVMGTHPPEIGDVTHNSLLDSSLHSASHQHHLHTSVRASDRIEASSISGPASASSNSALAVPAPLTNGLDLDLEEVGVDTVPYPRRLTLIKQLAKSIIISWDPPLVPAGWGNVWSYNVYVDQELRLNVPFGAQTKAVLERLDINLKAYRVSVQSLTEKGLSDQLRCSMLIGRDVCVAPTQLRVDRVTATSANLSWLPSNSNYVHIVSLNEKECELVKAGCYSLCLNNLLPSLQYTVKVEARPHRTPWELPAERRERRSASINFSTHTAVSCPQSGNTGPPDAPLDVQLDHGPSPGIALVSWLPVTIDCTGTSNGVRVTGYTIYADKKKVLEVSSPTAGSALLGPSQIQSLQAAEELTVRTMSVHGESCDSFPVNVPSKIAAIMAGPVATAPVVPPLSCKPVGPTDLSSLLTFGNSAAKVSALPCPSPQERQISGLAVESANICPVPHSEVSSASFVKAWADPTSALTDTCEATVPVTKLTTPVINVTSPTSSAPQAPPVLASTQTPEVVPAVTLDPRRDADSPGTIRPFPSITEFIEDPCAKLGTPERIPTPPKAPITDLLNPLDTLVLRPPSTSPLDSEVEEEQENKRLVSIEEFLRQDQDPVYTRTQQSYERGLVEPPSDYLADNSRSDLSDILEEEEEELYSDQLVDAPARGYTVTASRLTKSEPSDSDEDVLERILKLPPQAFRSKQLFSIPEVTEEEDGGRKEPLPHHVQIQMRPSHLHASDAEHLAPTPQCHRHSHVPPQHHHFNRSLTRQGPLQVKPKMHHRVHYLDTIDTIGHPSEKEVRLCEDLTDRRVSVRCPPQCAPNKDRALLRGLGDRLRREAMLRSQKAAATAANPAHGPTPPRPYPVSKTVHTVRSPISRGMEIDVEYGTDDNEETDVCASGEVVLEQMSSEWWIEGAEMKHRGPSYRQGTMTESLEPTVLPNSGAGPSWGQDSELSSKSIGLQSRQFKGSFESPKTKDDAEFRIFVALFPYDPATMSPNPDAAEEELPFREGQIIRVYGDKDSDGFYRGESGGRLGYVPCNMVSEIQVEDEETRQELLQQGFLTTPPSIEKIGTRTYAQLPRRPVPPPKPRRSKKVESAALWEESIDSSSQDPSVAAAENAANPDPKSRRMVAIFDYDPRESSPNTDIEAELTFSAGDIIHVIGDMDEDGFFYAELNGQRGLVPSNFLQALPEDPPADLVSAQAAPEHKKESQGSSSIELEDPGPSTSQNTLLPQTEPNLTERSEPLPDLQLPANTTSDPVPGPAPVNACSAQSKKKKGFFSKGKKLFKRFGSSKKE